MIDRFEVAVEVGEVVESRVKGDVGNGAIAFQKGARGAGKAQANEVVLKAHAEVLLEETADRLRVQCGDGSGLFECDVLLPILLEEVEDALEAVDFLKPDRFVVEDAGEWLAFAVFAQCLEDFEKEDELSWSGADGEELGHLGLDGLGRA